jgi:tetratricopeptide (TPR) repeat protein
MNLWPEGERPDEGRISDGGSGRAALGDPGPIGADPRHATTRSTADAEAILDALGAWDDSYRRGQDIPIESLGVSDPALLLELHARIEKQKRLYAVLKRSETAPDASGETGDKLPVFPGYETLSRIGQGGMGVVYKARDLELGRFVAIKTIAAGSHPSPAERARFRAEAHAVARLQHPNIIAIHSIGEHDSRPYLSLEYAEGGSLSTRLAQNPLATRQAAELVETLAKAVHVAHQAGIVHRDLKPGNVLLTADGVPKVSDFGLAKLLDTDSARTVSGQILGSPSYMAPEQAEGHAKDVGPAVDIYALGAILYQCLTGKPPFVGESQLETLKLVTTTEVVLPRRLRPDVPRDLETICLKCLEKKPAQRYATAFDLALDLGRFNRGEPVRARRIGAARRLFKWARRHPWQTTSAATVSVAIAGFVGFMYWHNIQLRAEIGRTQAKAAEARRNYQEARATISAMLDRLRDRRLAGSPQLLDLFHDQREDALAFYDRILSQVDSNDPIIRADTAKALAEASLLQHSLGHTDLAEKAVRRAIHLIEGLRNEEPKNARFLRLHTDCLVKLSGYWVVLGRLDQALVVGKESVDLGEQLVAMTPDEISNLEQLATCHHTYAGFLGPQQKDRAKYHYQRAIEIRERIKPSEIPGVHNRLAQTLINLGNLHWTQNETSQAEVAFRRAEALLAADISEKQAPRENAAVTTGLLNVNWGGMLLAPGRYAESIARTDAGLAKLEPYLRLEPHDDEARKFCLMLHGNRAYAFSGMGRHRDSAQEWQRVVALSPEPVPSHYRIRLAMQLLHADDQASAFEQAKLVKRTAEIAAIDRYNLACLFALRAAAAKSDEHQPPERRVALAESHIADAFQWLKSAAEAGFFHTPDVRDHARNDPDLAILRGRPEFQKLIAPSR